jgi:hypothetical protein
MSADRCTDTTPLAPRCAAFSYASRNTPGEGRDVVTGDQRRNASATVTDDVSPSS